MKKNIKTFIFLFMVGIGLVACDSEKAIEENGIEKHVDHDPEGTVSLTEKQMQTLGLKLIQLEEKNMNQEIQVNGKLELPPQEKADITPMIGGVVKKIFVIEGDKVRKGQVLAIMHHPDFIQMQQDYSSSLQDFNFLEEEFKRNKKLHEEKVTSTTQFQKITADYNKAKVVVESFEVKLRMLGLNPEKIKSGTIYPTINVISPLNGTISLVSTNTGAYAAPMTKLFEVVNNDELHAGFLVYEKDINHIKVGQKIFFQTSGVDGEEFEAVIHNISPIFEENPKAIHVHADILKKSDLLIPGMYINGRILANDTKEKIVPNDAIVADGNQFFIFIKTSDKEVASKTSFTMVQVIKGVTNGGSTAIKFLDQYPDDIEIAGNSAYFLIAEMRKGEVEHEH